MLSKRILIPVIVVLSLGFRACLLEQALAIAAEWLPHKHHSPEAEQHRTPAPAHSHDQDGKEGLYCCDNHLNQFVISKGSADLQSTSFMSSFLFFIEETALESSAQTFDIRALKRPLTVRARDKYALSCLLHAPPLS